MTEIINPVENRRKAHRERAEELAEAALDVGSHDYRHIGPDRLLAAAQVYATLASA